MKCPDCRKEPSCESMNQAKVMPTTRPVSSIWSSNPIQGRADVNQTDADGNTPLHVLMSVFDKG
eukprot:4988168-Amphidinium_carterae.1